MEPKEYPIKVHGMGGHSNTPQNRPYPRMAPYHRHEGLLTEPHIFAPRVPPNVRRDLPTRGDAIRNNLTSNNQTY